MLSVGAVNHEAMHNVGGKVGGPVRRVYILIKQLQPRTSQYEKQTLKRTPQKITIYWLTMLYVNIFMHIIYNHMHN